MYIFTACGIVVWWGEGDGEGEGDVYALKEEEGTEKEEVVGGDTLIVAFLSFLSCEVSGQP